MLTVDNPESAGLDVDRWHSALDLVRNWCRDDQVPAAGLLVARSGKTTGVHLFGRQSLSPDSAPIREDAIFLAASITKPVVATAVLQLIERGVIVLDDRVVDSVSEFGAKGKHDVTIRHLLTHTSGLPVSLSNNSDLKAAQAPLSAFVKCTCEVGLEFPSGSNVQYSDLGFCVLGELLARVTGKPCGQVLRHEIFVPLGMTSTVLGAPDSWFNGPNPIADQITEVRLPPNQHDRPEYDWNSRYQRMLGSPWGSLLTTPADLGNFALMWLNGGLFGTKRLLSGLTVEAATNNQLAHMPTLPKAVRRCEPRGLAWWLSWPGSSMVIGDLAGPRMYGHWGTSGTVISIDPDRDALVVFLTTQSQTADGPYLPRMCNAIAAAML